MVLLEVFLLHKGGPVIMISMRMKYENNSKSYDPRSYTCFKLLVATLSWSQNIKKMTWLFVSIDDDLKFHTLYGDGFKATKI